MVTQSPEIHVKNNAQIMVFPYLLLLSGTVTDDVDDLFWAKLQSLSRSHKFTVWIAHAPLPVQIIFR